MNELISDNVTGADNQQERLRPNWIVGFVDGEGCFSVSRIRNQTTKFGYQLFPEFVVTQSARSVQVLKGVQDFFGCGKVFINNRNDNHREPMFRYRVRSLKELTEIIIPFFDEHLLVTDKKNDYQVFRTIALMMANKEHLELSGFEKIDAMRQTMNRGKNKVEESSETTRQTF